MKSVLLGCALAFASFAASASEGTVFMYESGCSYYIVETQKGFVLLNWYGGKSPSEGDTLVGDLETYGLKTMHNLTADEDIRVFVEASGLSEADALQRFREECE